MEEMSSFFMTAPRNTQNLPYGLPGGCCRLSTVKGKIGARRIAAGIAKLPSYCGSRNQISGKNVSDDLGN